MNETARVLSLLPESEPFREEELMPESLEAEDGFTVRVEDHVFVVEGRGADQLIDSVNFDDEESVNWFHRVMRQSGIIDALRRAGAGEGSTVRMSGM